ncbi:hypothetical protein TNCV_1716961 [Trichonephila clavipes]|nr:hypothetical protein TNCV_1716961 [Trichonephila clavipes]
MTLTPDGLTRINLPTQQRLTVSRFEHNARSNAVFVDGSSRNREDLVCDKSIEGLPVGVLWQFGECLSPPHAYTMGMKQMTGWVSTNGTLGSNLKSQTRTGAKIL